MAGDSRWVGSLLNGVLLKIEGTGWRKTLLIGILGVINDEAVGRDEYLWGEVVDRRVV